MTQPWPQQPEQNPPAKNKGKAAAIGAIAGILVVLLAALAVLFVRPDFFSGGATNAVLASPNYAVSVKGATITLCKQGVTPKVGVDVYFDYMCPYCGQFERSNNKDLKKRLDAGEIQLSLHAMSFLDEASNGTRYSTRAANAALAVATRAPEAFYAFHEALFANQPAESTQGISDEEIAELAALAGVPQTVIATFAQLQNANIIATGTQADFDIISGTPSVFINDQPFTQGLYERGELENAIAKLIQN